MRRGLNALLKGVPRDKGEELNKALAREVAHGFFAAAQNHIHFYFIPLGKEFHGLPDPQFKVMAAGFEPYAQHLYLRDVLFLRPVLSLLSRLFIFEAAEVHHFYYGGIGGRRDFNNIKLSFLGDVEYVFKRHIAEIFTCLVNGANARRADLIVDAVASKDG